MEATLPRIIYEEACWLLENVGVQIVDPLVIKLFTNTGMAVYDDSARRIHIYRVLSDACVVSTPKRNKFPVSERSFGGGGVAAFIKRGDDYLTPITRIHIADMMSMAEEFKVPFMFKGASGKFTFEEEETQIKYMRREYTGFLYVRAESSIGLEKCYEDYSETGKLATTHSILNSPLMFNETGTNLRTFIRAAEMGLPLYLTTMPLSCLTGPATIYGMCILATAEFLAGLCLAQLINPGVMVINGAYPAITDISKQYRPALGSVSHNLANYVCARVSNLIGVPSIQSGNTITGEFHNPIEGGTDSETERGYKLWNGWDNWHQVRHSFGFVNTLVAFDLDKMRRDLVALDRIIKNDEVVSPETVDVRYDGYACYAILEGIMMGGFKDLNHTLQNVGILDHEV